MRRPTGFTLIEMLVVVAIIVLLISMLMPALKRNGAKATVCASHESQIITAGVFYGNDNRGYLPCGSGSINSSTWSKTWDELLLPYGASLDMILCPEQKEGTRHYWVNGNYVNAYSGYNNKNQTGVMSLGFSVRPAGVAVSRPSNTVGWMEMRYQYAGYADGGVSVPGSGWASIAWVYQDYFIGQYPHDTHANYAFLDGHIERMTLSEGLVPDGAGGYTFEKMKRIK